MKYHMTGENLIVQLLCCMTKMFVVAMLHGGLRDEMRWCHQTGFLLSHAESSTQIIMLV